MYNLRMNKIVVLILSVSVIFQACTVSLEVPDNFAQEIGNNIALNDSSNDQVEILKNKINDLSGSIDQLTLDSTGYSASGGLNSLNKRVTELEKTLLNKETIVANSSENESLPVTDMTLDSLQIQISVIADQINSIKGDDGIGALITDLDKVNNRLDGSNQEILVNSELISEFTNNLATLQEKVDQIQVDLDTVSDTSIIDGKTVFYGFNPNTVSMGPAVNWYLDIDSVNYPATSSNYLKYVTEENLVNYDEGYYADDDGFDSTNMSLVPGSLVVLYESTDRTTKKVSIEDITPSVDMFSISSSYISLDQQVTISDTLKLVVRYKYTNK